MAESFSISLYQVSSSSISKGLTPGLAILAVIVGHVLVAIPAMLDGYIGAKLGINFPVYCRSAFGMRGANAAVFIRGCVAVIWFGTEHALCHQAYCSDFARQAHNPSKAANA